MQSYHRSQKMPHTNQKLPLLWGTEHSSSEPTAVQKQLTWNMNNVRELTRVHDHDGRKQSCFTVSQTKPVHLQCKRVQLIKEVTQRHQLHHITTQSVTSQHWGDIFSWITAETCRTGILETNHETNKTTYICLLISWFMTRRNASIQMKQEAQRDANTARWL